MKRIIILLLALISLAASGAEAKVPAPTNDRMAWWHEARFGMFIHYGPVSLTGQEISWSRANSNTNCPNHGATPVAVYDQLYQQFNPTNFNAADWAGVAKAAGMKYVVLTAKHCDGFLLWDSKVDGYNIMHTPFRRDLCAELAAAVRQDGLRLGWYFSPMDWRDPDFRTERNAAFVARMQGELSELLNNYGRIDVMWFDWDSCEPLYDQANTYAMVKKFQPQAVIDNRLDLRHGDNDRMMLSPLADYYTPEQHIGAYDDQRPWETCMTLGTQWSWKPNDPIKSPAEVVGILCSTAGGDGNLLLDVGPTPDGRIEPHQVEVLQQVGAWLAVNGEAIYGTRGGPWKPTKQITSTRKGRVIYLHVTGVPDGQVKLPALPAKILSATLLSGEKVEALQQAGKLVVRIPVAALNPMGTMVKLEVDRPALEIPAIDVRPAKHK